MDRVSAEVWTGFRPGDGTRGVMSERPVFFLEKAGTFHEYLCGHISFHSGPLEIKIK